MAVLFRGPSRSIFTSKQLAWNLISISDFSLPLVDGIKLQSGKPHLDNAVANRGRQRYKGDDGRSALGDDASLI